MGSKTYNQSSQQTNTPVAQGALQNIYNTVSNAAQNPYVAYNGELVAPVNQQQTTGINNINASANSAQPYFSQAGQLVTNAANPLTTQQIQNYENPYTQAVVNATQNQFNDQNAQAQSQLKGTIAQQGALGGDRQAVAQAVLSGQQQMAQAPVIANLESQGYNNALQTAAQQYQQNPMAAAASLENVGAGGQNAALQGAGAQINAGTLQQQTQQALDQANYGQYQAKQGFPFQEAAFLEQYGLPSALAQGSTGTGYQSMQGPSPIAPYLGAGIAGLGLFAKDGGAIEKGGGGYITSDMGYIPTGQASQNTLRAPNLSFMKPQTQSSNPVSGMNLSGIGSSLSNNYGSASFGGGNLFTDDAWGGDKNNPLPGLDASDYGYNIGGFVKAVHHIHRSIKGHYDDGGDVSFADRFQPAIDAPLGDMSRGQAIMSLAAQNGDNPFMAAVPSAPPTAPDNAVINPDEPFRMPDQAAVQDWRNGVDTPNPAVTADAGLPPQITNPDGQPTPTPLAFAGDNAPLQISPMGQPAQPDQGHGFSLFGASDKAKNALIAAGLGIMASRSPFLGNAIGEGGLQGLRAYSDMTQAEQEAADKAASRGMEQQRIDIQAKQLAANLENQRRAQATSGLIPDGKGGWMVNPSYIALKQAERDVADKAPPGYRENKDGTLEAIPGGPADPNTIKTVAEAKRVANAVLDDDTVHDMAAQYLAGDRTVMQNLGRGAQGAENIVKLRQAIAKQAREAGVDPKGIVNAFNEQAGALAGQRAVGVRAANISLAANEANNMIPIALEASAKVPRTQYMPWNQMVQAVQKGTSSPELASFVAATNSLVNAYVRAVSPSGVPTDSMRQHAYDMLNSAQGPEAYKAVVATMQKEMEAALKAPGAVREELRKGNDPTAAAMPQKTDLGNKPKTVTQNGHTYTLQPDGSYK